MAILDKITSAAATITDKASDAVEITKIKTRINGEQKEIERTLAEIGRIYYEKAKAGEEVESNVLDLVNKVSAQYEVLADLEKNLEAIDPLI